MNTPTRELDAFAGQMLESLSAKEVKNLRDDLAAIGLEAWLDWECEHRAETTAFLTATPTQRAAKTAWQEERLRSRLVLSGFLQVRLARVMQFEASNLLANQAEDGAAARAINAAFRVLHTISLGIWPFSGKAPFPEWEAERQRLNQGDLLAYGHSMPDGSVRSFLRSPHGDIPLK